MHELDDNALLREFAERGSEPAFGELVARHINKVHSVALRQVRNPHQAQEITQAVFVLLAQKARELHHHAMLSGWLYQTARLTAVTLVHSDIRRARREQEVLMQNLPEESIADPWPHIAPLLDEAMADLSETDRHAVVLRYFDGKSLRDVGAALGASEDAAKMRVNRAVEKLRGYFTKRGVTLSAAGLTTAITANAVQAAPAGLAAVVTAGALAGTTLTTAVVLAASKSMAMTTLQKTIITLIVTALAGAGIYETRQAARLREQNQTLQQALAPLAEQVRQLEREGDKSTNMIAWLKEELAKNAKKNAELLKLRGEVALLEKAATEMNKSKNASKSETPSPSPHPPWALREQRKFNEFQNVGTDTAEAAAETVLWAAQNNATNLLDFISLPTELLEESKTNGLTEVFTRQLAAKILFQASVVTKGGAQSAVWIDAYHNSGGNPTTDPTSGSFTETNEKEKFSYYGVMDFKLCGRSDINDPLTERFTTFPFAKINGAWRLIIPGVSPELLPPSK